MFRDCASTLPLLCFIFQGCWGEDWLHVISQGKGLPGITDDAACVPGVGNGRIFKVTSFAYCRNSPPVVQEYQGFRIRPHDLINSTKNSVLVTRPPPSALQQALAVPIQIRESAAWIEMTDLNGFTSGDNTGSP
jgi:hypothetical protein